MHRAAVEKDGKFVQGRLGLDEVDDVDPRSRSPSWGRRRSQGVLGVHTYFVGLSEA
jgi:hypothetical protein